MRDEPSVPCAQVNASSTSIVYSVQGAKTGSAGTMAGNTGNGINTVSGNPHWHASCNNHRRWVASCPLLSPSRSLC